MSEQEMASLVGIILGLIGVFVGLVVFVIGIIACWKIFAKAGWSGAMGLLMFVPIANLIVFLMLAFAKWPIQRELEAARGGRGGSIPGTPGAPPPPPADPWAT
jgi:heme/copper-type cytochrome/quinol oxidase subunit 2